MSHLLPVTPEQILAACLKNLIKIWFFEGWEALVFNYSPQLDGT
jgi:hypothetical protein